MSASKELIALRKAVLLKRELNKALYALVELANGNSLAINGDIWAYVNADVEGLEDGADSVIDISEDHAAHLIKHIKELT